MMRSSQPLIPLWAVLVGLSLAGCNSLPSGQADARVVDATFRDAGSRDATMADGGSVADAFAAPSALQAVVNKLLVPTSGTEYARDYEGKGEKKNRFGTINQLVSSFNLGLTVQATFDNILDGAVWILLVELFADSLGGSGPAQLKGYVGEDQDAVHTAEDNFSGSELFGKKSTAGLFTLPGTLASGAVKVGPASGTFPIWVEGAEVVTARFERLEVTAKASASGMTEGQLTGLVPKSDWNEKVIPRVVRQIDYTYKHPSTSQSSRDKLRDVFDANKDGTITVDEFMGNTAISSALGPDVDTDGDGKPDAVSMGLGFTAVPCTIKK
ncbi:MAG: hypothetical protein IT371_00480 [Deltaproteobacteria bacterium]|nr:hypothetical protein [Deltaproteobacteria bacterium]